MGDEMNKIISLCLENWSQIEVEVQGNPKDLEGYFQYLKKEVPSNSIHSMSLEEKKEYLKYLYTNNNLSVLHSKEIQYIILCSILEKSLCLTVRIISSKLNYVPKKGEDNLGIWIFDSINSKYQDPKFLCNMRKLIKQFKQYEEGEIPAQSSEEQNNDSSKNAQNSQKINNKSNSQDYSQGSNSFRNTFHPITQKFQQFANILDPSNQFKEDGVMDSNLETYVKKLRLQYGEDDIKCLFTYEFFKNLNQAIKEKDPTYDQIDQFLINYNFLKPNKLTNHKINRKDKNSKKPSSPGKNPLPQGEQKEPKEPLNPCQNSSQQSEQKDPQESSNSGQNPPQQGAQKELQEPSNPCQNSPRQDEEEGEEQVGGIKFNIKPKSLKKILGFKILPDKSLRFLVDKREDSPEDSGVDSEDLALCLSIYLDKSIRHKNISFSLDPWDDTNPNGPFQRKIFYPDVHEKKQIYEGSKFGELMFECDFVMKQMLLGVKGDSKTPFDYPESLSSKGFSYKSFDQREETKSDHNWSRCWLLCEAIDGMIDPNKQGIFLDQDVKIKVDARQMIVDPTGKLVDNPIQDPTQSSYKFAAKMTELYEDICKEFPCFQKLKKLYRAAAMARWIVDSGVPIDLEKVKEIASKQFEYQDSFTNKINALSFVHETKLPDEIIKEPIDPRELAIKVLNNSNFEVTEERIEDAINQLAQRQGGSREFFQTQTRTQTYRSSVFGGVKMVCEIQPIPKQESLNESFSDASTTYSSIEDERIKMITDEEDFIFSVETYCKVCDVELNNEETYFPFEEEFYCHYHHPLTCYYCMDRIQRQEEFVYINGTKEIYNTESFVGKQVFFHKDCGNIFLQKCRQMNQKKNEEDFVKKQNANLINQIQKYKQNVKTSSDIKLQKPKPFICQNCQKLNQRNETITCSSCGIINTKLLNIFINQD